MTDVFDKAYLTDKGYNIYFEQLGYDSKYIIFNCANIIFLIVLWMFICLVTFVVETVRGGNIHEF